MTGIPYGPNGSMFALRPDHDDGIGDCFCSRLPARGEFWQRGCPTTGLPPAPAWRPQSSSDVADDAMVRVRLAVAEAHQRVVAEITKQGRVRQVEGHAEVLAADQSAGHDTVEPDAPELATGGVA